jgi:tartrate/fumarate subfamily iron-sulfur-dependent hydro-lyase beta chain
LRAATEGILPPLDYGSINAMMHVGPIVKRIPQGWLAMSMTPTTSIRMEKFCASLLRKLQTRVIIGKGTMGQDTVEAMREVGAVHLCGLGINPSALASHVTSVREVHFLEEIGPTEATWVFEVSAFGPFVVDIDASGNSFFSSLYDESLKRLHRLYAKHNIPLDYQYTDI